MKKKGIPYGLLAFAIFWLMYNTYYWLMRRSAGVLRNIDTTICMTGGFVCIVLIIIVIIKSNGKRHR